MTQLTPHFSFDELTQSDTAQRLGIDNKGVDFDVMDNLYTLSAGLERVRMVLQSPMRVNSGYRCPRLNAAVKGAKDSAHMKGLAADFTAPRFGEPIDIVRAIVEQKEAVAFNRIIQEGTWVHIDFPPYGEEPKYLVLTASFGPNGTTYQQGV